MSDVRLRELERHAFAAPEARAALMVAEVRSGRRRVVALHELFLVPGISCPECGCSMWGEVECFDSDTREAVVVMVRCEASEEFGNHDHDAKDDWDEVQEKAEAWALDHLWVRPESRQAS